MEVDEILTELKKKAAADPALQDKILRTKEDPQPISAFCALVRSLGWPLYEMDLISAGEDYYAAMRRSTNGGGENSPALSYEDDYYELFIADIRRLADKRQ